MTFIPAIVRISGFSAEVMEPFSSVRCTQEIELLFELERDLDRVRAELANRLFEKVSGAPAEVRRLLLSVKRDCHNGRSLTKWRSAQFRAIFDQAAPGLMDRLFDLERRVETWCAQFREVFCQERERERDVLCGLVEDGDFRRGLALAAPTLVKNLGRLRKKSRYGRKERGMDQSLLRYVSRTAFKLSPFSTFTRVGLGVLSDDVHTGAIQLREGAWLLKSLTRLKKQVPAQYFAILQHDEAFRSRLDIRLNDTIERVADNKYRFIRAGGWIFSEEKKGLYFQLESLVNVRLQGELIEETQQRLGNGRFMYESLVTELAEDVSRQVSEVADSIDKLIDIGFLRLQAPWQGTEVDVDNSFLAYLRSLPESELPCGLIQIYERLESLKKAYRSTGRPEEVIEEIDRTVNEGFQLLGQGLFLSSVERPSQEARYLNEDVFVLAGVETQSQELARINIQSAKKAIASIQPLLRFANLFSHRHDFLCAMHAFIAERWPGRCEVSVLDVFEQMQDLWLNYRRFVNQTYSSAAKLSWNPFDLSSLVSLQDLRNKIWSSMKDLFRIDSGEIYISPDEVHEMMGQVSMDYAPMVGPCLFIQPADNRGDIWISNRILEGTGRFGSRYTGLMDAEMRQRYTDRSVLCSSFELDGEPVEILDLASVSGNYLNVHAIQTPRVLDLPGELRGLGEERQLRLKDLRVRVSHGGSLPVLVDLSGKRVLPTHLGVMSMRLMPSLTRFLAQFGPGEFGYPIPPLPALQEGDVTIYRRVRIGNVIIRRKRWIIPAEPWRQMAQDVEYHKLFEHVSRWRLAHGVPSQVFLSEKLPEKFFEQEVYKPQYVDFTSPLFLAVLASILKAGQERLAIEEMLPTPDMFPTDGDGRRWAVELQLDSLFMGQRASGASRSQSDSGKLPPVRPSSMSEGGDCDLSPA